MRWTVLPYFAVADTIGHSDDERLVHRVRHHAALADLAWRSRSVLVSSAITTPRMGLSSGDCVYCRQGFSGGDLAFAQHGVDTGNVSLHGVIRGRVLELTGDELEPQVEQFLF